MYIDRKAIDIIRKMFKRNISYEMGQEHLFKFLEFNKKQFSSNIYRLKNKEADILIWALLDADNEIAKIEEGTKTPAKVPQSNRLKILQLLPIEGLGIPEEIDPDSYPRLTKALVQKMYAAFMKKRYYNAYLAGKKLMELGKLDGDARMIYRQVEAILG